MTVGSSAIQGSRHSAHTPILDNAFVSLDYYCAQKIFKNLVFVEDAQSSSVFVEEAQEDAKTIVFLLKTLKALTNLIIHHIFFQSSFSTNILWF